MGADISKCIEKKDLIAAIKSLDELNAEDNEDSESDKRCTSTTYYKKKKLSSRTNEIIWFNSQFEEKDEIPYDIDNACVYVLPFDSQNKMSSSKDGKKWKVWTTSSQCAFNGVPRKACCSGSFRCNNQNCAFLKFYQEINCLQFNPANNTCSGCGEFDAFVECDAKKIWEFDESRKLVTVYHDGYHT